MKNHSSVEFSSIQREKQSHIHTHKQKKPRQTSTQTNKKLSIINVFFGHDLNGSHQTKK